MKDPEEMFEFKKWIENKLVNDRRMVEGWIVDAFWKNKLNGTDLLRAYLMRKKEG